MLISQSIKIESLSSFFYAWCIMSDQVWRTIKLDLARWAQWTPYSYMVHQLMKYAWDFRLWIGSYFFVYRLANTSWHAGNLKTKILLTLERKRRQQHAMIAPVALPKFVLESLGSYRVDFLQKHLKTHSVTTLVFRLGAPYSFKGIFYSWFEMPWKTLRYCKGKLKSVLAYN